MLWWMFLRFLVLNCSLRCISELVVMLHKYLLGWEAKSDQRLNITWWSLLESDVLRKRGLISVGRLWCFSQRLHWLPVLSVGCPHCDTTPRHSAPPLENSPEAKGDGVEQSAQMLFGLLSEATWWWLKPHPSGSHTNITEFQKNKNVPRLRLVVTLFSSLQWPNI